VTEFAPERALGYARELAIPRLVGSKNEAAVLKEVVARLERVGYVVSKQPFEFSTALNLSITGALIASSSLILVSILMDGLPAWGTISIALGLLAILTLLRPISQSVQSASIRPDSRTEISYWSRLCLRLGPRHKAKNIIASLPEHRDGDPSLYLVAHYDSKSQRFSLVLRIGFFVASTVGMAIFAVLSALGVAIPVLSPIVTILGWSVILCNLPLIFMKTGNSSPGAIDNASGLGLVLHLAEHLAPRDEINRSFQVKVLITGAEEYGALGAAAFAKSYAAKVRGQPTNGASAFLNFDGIGADGKLTIVEGDTLPRRSNSCPLAELVQEASISLQIPLGRFALPGAMFDHIPFSQEGFDSVSLITVGKGTGTIHTRKDTVDRLHAGGFEQAGRVALKVIEKLGTE